MLVGIQDPVASFLRQFSPWTIDVVTERSQHVAQVAAMPGGRPGCNRALTNAFGIIRHHRAFGYLVDPTEPMASGTGSRRRIGRKRLGIEMRLLPWIVAGARVQHSKQVGQRRDAADGRARGGRPALLLQGNGRRQAIDFINLGNRHLMKETPRIRRDGFEIPPLRLRIERSKGQRRFARAGHTGKHHQGIAGNGEIDILQIMLACSTHADETSQLLARCSLRTRLVDF